MTRSRKIGVRVLPAERRAILAAAYRRGMTVSEFMRRAVLDKLDRENAVRGDLEP